MIKKIFIAALALGLAISAAAQQMPPIPVDEAVRIGKLENGLTYYVRHNEEPKGQANFYIAQKVGSILEDDNQRGLAHFLEHMCFNGTEKFPGNNVVKYCESIGVKFGADLNAYTSIDETVYNIDNVPVAKVPEAVDSCLWILHDWADGLLLNGEDIDHERGVIHEEWRSRMNATMRQYEVILPEIYQNNKYGVRMPIGTMEVVDNFPYQAIRDYYEKWYRPDQQGIVVVGDIDVDAVEAKIKDIFGTIATPVNPAERYYVPVEDNVEPIVAIAKDKEQPVAMAYIFKKHEKYPDEMKGDLNYLVIRYAMEMAVTMINERIDELAQLPEPPFMQAGVSEDDFFISKTKGSLMGVSVSSPEGFEKGVTTVYREMLRAIRNGFSASEYERARSEYLTHLESAYNDREKIKSQTFCKEYVRHFIDNEPIPGIENEYMLMNQLAPNIPVEAINGVLAQVVGADNLVLACMLPDKEGVEYPSKEELIAALKAVEAEDIAAYEDKVSDEPLIANLPVPGRITASENSVFGYKHYTLSNGVNVYVKTTDFKADQILMKAVSRGGVSLYPMSDALSLKVVDEVFTVGGVGNFSVTDLNKALSGKKVSVIPSISTYGESIKGSAAPKFFEDMMQLTYLYFTAPRSDEDAFKSWQSRTRTALQNQEANPMTALQDELSAALYQGHPLSGRVKAADVDNVDYARIMQIAKERFANAADFDFIFTGNFDETTMLPMIEQYIGSLPAKGKKEKAKDIKLDMAQGKKDVVFDKPMQIPAATVIFIESGKAKYDLRHNMALNIADQVLDILYTEEIREKEGGTYGVSCNSSTFNVPKAGEYLQIVYQTDPDKVDHLNGMILDILKDLAKNGPSEENLAKVKDYKLKKFTENQRENGYFESALEEYLDSGEDVVSTYKKTLASITANDVKAAIAELLSQGNSTHVVMKGVPME